MRSCVSALRRSPAGRWRRPGWARTRCRRHRSRRRPCSSRAPCRSGSGCSKGASSRPAALHLVEADAADRGDARVGPDVVLERRAGRQRLEVVLDQLAAGRILLAARARSSRSARSRRSAALSMLYSQGENMRTCAHWRTAWPTCGAGLEHDRLMPRSSTCAAAARPTGPAPRMATVFCAVRIAVLSF